MDAAHFELTGVALPDGEDPLGLWDVAAPPPVLEAVAFSAQAAPEPPTWSIALPGDAAQAVAWLRRQQHALTLAQGDLARAESELRRFDPDGIAFSSAAPLGREKESLRRSLEAARAPVAFGRAPAETEDEATTRRQFEGFVAQVQRMLAQYARIETTLGGAPVALSSVSWTGNFTTRWPASAPPAHITLHRQAVQTALGSRLALVRLAAIVAGGAVGLTVKASIPGGQLLLLPAAWKFVRDVLKELRAAWPTLQLPVN